MENTQEIIQVARGRPRKPKPIEEENIEKRPRGRPRKPPPDPNLPKPPRKKKKFQFGGTIDNYILECIIRIGQKKNVHVLIVAIRLILSLH